MPRGNGGKDRKPPVINITSPTNGTVIAPNTQFTVTATATDNVGVMYVIFSFASQSITDFSAPYSATFTTPNLEGYNALLRVTAFDAAGNQASQSFYILVSSTTTTTTTSYTPPPPPPTLPASKILVTPTAFGQGGEGSCMSCANALNRTIEEYYITGSTSYSESTNILSPEWVYNLGNANNTNLTWTCVNSNDTSTCTPIFKSTLECAAIQYGCGIGSAMIYTSEMIRTIGVPRWSICPYSDANGCCSDWFTPTMTNDAALHKITKFKSASIIDRYTIKRMINNNHAGSFGTQIDSNMYNCGADVGIAPCNYIWRSRGTLMAAHAMVIIGYDDSKQAWLVQNSWGPNWGCNGRIWLDYAFAEAIISNIYFYTTRTDQNYYNIL